MIFNIARVDPKISPDPRLSISAAATTAAISSSPSFSARIHASFFLFSSLVRPRLSVYCGQNNISRYTRRGEEARPRNYTLVIRVRRCHGESSLEDSKPRQPLALGTRDSADDNECPTWRSDNDTRVQ